jgi:ADP-heptose:LPS heptosyltransferase
MKAKATLRRLLLLPIQPRPFALGLGLLRTLGILPLRIASQWPPKRILVINLTRHLGDAMMTMPLIDALSRALPEACIDLVIESPLDDPLRSVSSLRRVYRIPTGKSKIPIVEKYLRIGRMLRFARREWMHETYDLALLPRWGTDPSMASYLAAMSTAPQRCGHDPQEERTAEQVFPGTEALLTVVSHGGEGMAEGVRQQLLLVACGIIKDLDAAAEERRTSKGVLEIGLSVDVEACVSRLELCPDGRFILLAPGASHASRRWPGERFAQFGNAMSRRTGHFVYIIGGPEDRELGERIEVLSCGSVRNLAGSTSVPETIALTQRAALLVTNDSGPAHIGGALGTPTLVLSACPKASRFEHANSPGRVRPVGPRVKVLQPDLPAGGCADRCQNPDSHCILGITVDLVEAEAMTWLETPAQIDPGPSHVGANPLDIFEHSISTTWTQGENGR